MKSLITDFLNFDQKNQKKSVQKTYLELPVFDENYEILNKNISYKKWKNSKEKLDDIKKIFNLYDYFLSQLVVFLNKYHNKKHSKKYWSIILGQWLFKFISAVSFRWNLIKSLKRKKFIFLKHEISTREIIPLGIEDFTKMSNSNYWNHYIYTRIIENSFSNNFKIKKIGKITHNSENKTIYQNLNHTNIRGYISLLIQKILNYFCNKNSTLIFSTYMSNLEELKLNFLVNKSLLYYKILYPYHLFKQKKLFKFKRLDNYNNLKSHNKSLKSFLNKELINSIPSAYLENYNAIGIMSNQIPFPKSPKKIFTTLGIYRNTVMDRYIARNVENGCSLILAQHGGAYFQHKLHFSSIYELYIADKYLSWGKVKNKKTSQIGIIKTLKKTSKKKNMIILEVRKRTPYNTEIKLDTSFIESKKYYQSLCKFFSLIKNEKISKNIFIKLHQKKSNWRDKMQFLSHNPNLNFLDEKKIMINEIMDAKLVIYTSCSTGHLENLSVNRPTLILFIHDLNLLNYKTKNYYKKFIEAGIVHTTPQSLYEILQSLDSDKKIQKWWNSKKLQKLVNNYNKDYAFFNKNKLDDLKKIITDL